MSGTTKAVLAIVLLVVVGAVSVIALRSSGNRGFEVRVGAVDTRDLVATVTASGNIRARMQVDISSDIAARVQSLYVAEGQTVEQGDLLLELERTQFEAAVNRARAGLSQSQANAAQLRASLLRAQREYDRTRSLLARDSLLISRQQLEDAETNLQVAEANFEAAEFAVEQSQASLDEAQDRLDRTIFRAPMSGTVTRLNVEEGETVIVGTMNNPGSLILTIADLSVVEAVVRVDETDVPLLSLGDRAEVEIDAFPGELFTGRVTQIGNSAIQAPSQQAGVQQAVDFEVVITLDPAGTELRPDLSSTSEIITDTRDGAVAVPIIAVTVREIEGPGGQPVETEGVFTVSGDEVTFVPVELGIAGGEHFEVRSGLNPGDSVVAGPYQAIRQLQTGDLIRRTGVSESGSEG
jgi:HlyD family secretion protein